MKAWRDLKSVKKPFRMRALPLDPRGYPIPWVAAVGEDGKHDFRVLDVTKVGTCLRECRCSICGGRINGLMAFVGGPLSIANRLFNDPPMHQECAVYALQVCPYLAAPSFAYARKLPSMEGVHVEEIPGMMGERPEVFGLGLSSGLGLAVVGGGTYIRPAAWESTVLWFKQGVQVEFTNPYA